MNQANYENIPVGTVSPSFWQMCLSPQSATERKEVNEFLKKHGYLWKRSGTEWVLGKHWDTSATLDMTQVVLELKAKQQRQQRAA